MYYDLQIQPLSEELEKRYLEMSEYGFFEKYRGYQERKLASEKHDKKIDEILDAHERSVA